MHPAGAPEGTAAIAWRAALIATRLQLRDFRSYEAADVRLGPGLTVISGRNGAGKTNLLEALYFACTGRSCRTANEREVVRFGAELTRLELECEDALGRHAVGVGFKPGEAKRLQADGAPVERLDGRAARPLVSVFLPDRLELVLGAPSLRRVAPGPGRRRAVAGADRHAPRLLRRARAAQRAAGVASAPAERRATSLPAWDAELARHGVHADGRSRGDGRAARGRASPSTPRGSGWTARSSCATGRGRRRPTRRRWPRSWPSASDADLERGFTGHGPHRDDLAFRRDGRELRAYGSRGQQRLGLLALLLAEREELAAERGAAPLLLLDDVMSELDATRRERLADAAAPRRPGGDHHHRARRTCRGPSGRRRRLAVVDGACGRRGDDGRVASRAGDVGLTDSASRACAACDGAAGARARETPRRRGRSASRSRRLADALAPPTLLAGVQRAWPEAAGAEFAHALRAGRERDGVVTVACDSATWAARSST